MPVKVPPDPPADPDRSIAALTSAISSGLLSAVSLSEACLARVAAREPQLHAFAWIEPDHVRELASEVDNRPRHLTTDSGVHGIPVAVKDIFDTAGVPTEYGSALFRGRIPETSASTVDALITAGAVIFGKTVTAELAFATPGPTVNPYDPERTPGGSSMGSPAAVAAGMIPAAIGTQTNSSTIMPASLCGVVGLKPTGGRIPMDGVLRFSETLDQIGCFARTVADAAIIAASVGPQNQSPRPLTRPPRVGVARTRDWHEAAPAVRARFDEVVALLDATDAHVVNLETPPAFDAARAVHRTIMAFEAARALRDTVADGSELLSAPLNRFLAEGADVSAADYESALRRRASIVDAFDAWVCHLDVVLTPAAPDEAPSRAGTGDPRFCTTWSLVAAPAMALPAGFGPSGLPIGIQLVAARDDDQLLLDVGHTVEQHMSQLRPR